MYFENFLILEVLKVHLEYLLEQNQSSHAERNQVAGEPLQFAFANQFHQNRKREVAPCECRKTAAEYWKNTNLTSDFTQIFCFKHECAQNRWNGNYKRKFACRCPVYARKLCARNS